MPQRVSPDALARQFREFCVQFRGHLHRFVVGGEQLLGALALLGRIEGTIRYAIEWDLLAAHFESDVFQRRVVHDPRPHPVDKTLRVVLAGPRHHHRWERPKLMQRDRIPNCPRGERNEGEGPHQ